MNVTEIVGARVQDARRRRGLTQRELAAASRVSVSLVRKLEQGEYANGLRLETLRRIAVALDVTTSTLMSEPDAADAEPGNVAAWEPVRRALASDYDGAPDDEPTIGGVRDAFNDAVDAALASHYAELAVTLPALLRDADALVTASPEGRAGVRARQVRSQARQLAGYMMGQTWQFEAAATAISLAAADPGDDLTALAAADWQAWVLLRSGRLAECGRLAARWADDAEPRLPKASPDELAAWGLFCIRTSNAAVRDNRPDDAREALRLARMAAHGVSRDFIPSFSPWQVFGPVTVAMFAAENAMISGRPEVTLSIGAQVSGRGFPVPRNYHRHRLDVASAYAATRKFDEATGVLAEVRSAAPEWLAQQRYARDILAMVIARKRRLSDELRDLADFMHLPL